MRALLPRKLSTQLIILFMATFLFVLTVSFLLFYTDIADILSRSYQNSSIEQFMQCDYNISNFCNTVDLISRQLVIDADLQSLDDYANLSESDRVYRSSTAIRHFNGILSNYRYINSILYYTSEGLIIKCSANANDVLFDAKSAGDWFYKSAPYMESNKSKQKIVWFGGYTSGDFGVTQVTPANTAPLSGYYVSASRNVLSGNATGTLVININMEQFTSVYSNQNAGQDGRMYIIDGDGKVISGNDSEMVGKKSDTLQIMDPRLSTQTFSFNSKGGKMQAVYYRLRTPIGILISEIPVRVITKDVVNLRNIVLLMFCLSLLLAFVLFRFWLSRLMRPLKALIGVIKGVGRGNLGLTLRNPPHNEFGTLIDQFNNMSSNIKELFQQKMEAETGKRDLEMETLRSQINPHFIYNTLNIIKWMAVIDRKNNIADCVTTFTQFLEVVLREHGAMYTLREELNHLNNYIKIMNYRFAGGLKLETDISEEYLDCRIIRFILQPIVENSVVHGLVQQVGGVIRVCLSSRDGEVEITVADNGGGIEEARLAEVNRMLQEGALNSENCIGLPNVSKRLKLHFGGRYGISLQNGELGGAIVTLRMPLVR